MSNQVYNQQYLSKFSAQPPAAAPRRHPFANAVGHNANQPKETAPRAQEKQKAPSSPPLPRQNSKTVPPSPPKIIYDKRDHVQYQRVGFLGEVWRISFSLYMFLIICKGGFARVYEVQTAQGSRVACKVVTKSSLKTKKAKTKVYYHCMYPSAHSFIVSHSCMPKSRFTRH
jgi:hypothetical protein